MSTRTIDQVKKRFDVWSKDYQDYMERHITTASLPILLEYMKAADPKRILEVGSGPGLGATQMLSTFDESVSITSTDLSQVMVELAKENVEARRQQLPNSASLPSITVEAQNGEALTYEDKAFDAYLSNMCIFLAPNTDKFIQESRRVLADGGVAVVSTWGRKEESPGFKLLDVYRKYAPLANEHKGSDVFPLEPKGASNYHLGGDKEALRQRFLDAGYSKVVTWYTSGHFPWFNGEQYADVMFTFAPCKPLAAALPDELRSQMHADLAASVQKEIDGGGPIKFDVLCVAAQA